MAFFKNFIPGGSKNQGFHPGFNGHRAWKRDALYAGFDRR